MEKAIFARQIEKARQRLEQLEQAAGDKASEKELLQEALEQLSAALVELEVSGEELNQQNEELASARLQIESERDHFQELFESTPDGYLVTDADATIREANRAAASLLGVRQDFLIGKPLIVFIAKNERKSLLSWLSQVGKNDRANLEVTLQPRKSQPFPVEMTVTVMDSRSKQTGLLWLVRDISQRKQVEAALLNSETEKAMILDSTSDMIAYYDRDLRIVWANAASGVSVGELPEALIGRYCYEIWHQRDSACEGCPILVARDTRRPAEYEHRTPSGEVFHLRGFPVLDEAGEVKGLIEFTQDITQRKKAEAAMQESEERFHTLAALAPVGIFLSDPRGNCTYANPRWLQMVGLTLEEVLGDGWIHAIYTGDRQRVVEQWGLYCKNPEIWNEEYRLQTPQGRVTWVSGIAAPILDSHGRLSGFVDIDVDISEYKRVVESLARSEKRYRGLFMESPISLWEEDFSAVRTQIDHLRAAGVTDLRRYFEEHPGAVGEFAALIKVVDVNQATLDLFKASSKAQLKQNLDKVFTDDSYELIREELIDLFEGKQQITREGFNRNMEGEKIFLELSLSVTPGSEENWSKVLISIVDNTKRKQIEETLRESEERYRHLVESSDDWVWEVDQNGIFTYASPRVFKMLGYEPDELVGKRPFDLMPADEARRVEAEFASFLARGEPFRGLENANLHKNGRLIIIESNGVPFFDREGRLSGYRGMDRDITERKRVEQALIRERDLLHTLMDNIPDTIYFKDNASRFTLVNRAHAQGWGLDNPEQVIGKTDLDFYAGNFARQAFQEEHEILQSGEPILDRIEFIPTADGEPRWYSSTKVPIINRQGQVDGLVGISRDITVRIQAEEALRKSEVFLNSIIEQSPLAMWISDDQGTLIRINQACCDLLNIKEEEVLGVYNILKDNIVEEQGYMPLVKRVFERGVAVRFELSYDVSRLENPILQRKANVFLDVTIFPVKDAFGKVTNVVIQNINITERKQAELALNEERNFINAILDNAAIVVNVLDREGRFVLVNKYFERVTGYSNSELEGRYIWDTTLPEDEARELKTYFNELWEGKFPKVVNNRVLTRTGAAVPFEWINTLIADTQGKPRYSLGVGLGLTERQKMEGQLRASLAEKEILLREVHHRVKNNLEVINSLAEMQTRRIADPLAIESLRQLQERIRTIALVHENLYRSANLDEIHAKPYLEKLTGNLYQAFGWPKLNLQAQSEDIIIPLDQAVPFGLIVTELVTNALKHAFPPDLTNQATGADGNEPGILVTLRAEGDQSILEVSDNGVGLPADLDWKNTRSLGLRLVSRLTDQLHGSVEAFTENGTTFRVIFLSQTAVV